MPVLLRIIFQRIIVAGLSVLTFLGISPEVKIPTETEAKIAIEERKERTKEIFNISASPQNDTAEVENNLEIKNPILNSLKTPTPPKILNPSNNSLSIDGAVVNIICLNKELNRINMHHGSGVLISPEGVVITNAHVAQNFLLKNTPRRNYMNCSISSEQTPLFAYDADILYIPTRWVEENYKLYTNPNPRGTGENDFAFLYIKNTSNSPIGKLEQFPYMPIETNVNNISAGDYVYVAGYPGKSTGVLELDTNTKLQKETVYIKEMFTFNKNSADVFSTTPTPVAKRGSSGGGVFKDNKMVGLIVTISPSAEGNENLINALSTSYINKTLKQNEGISVTDLISGDLDLKSQTFNDVIAPRLSKLLGDQILKN